MIHVIERTSSGPILLVKSDAIIPAHYLSGSAKVDSHYQRIQRFFKEIQLQQDAIARCVVSLLPYDQFVLSMDRTNWMLGCLAINFLVLSVVHQRTAF
ncbi:hypothetical protein C2W62_52690, partial [Candidatus Entotheonella serta]